MPILKGGNIASKYGDSDTVSESFASKLVAKYIKADEEVAEPHRATPGEIKAYLMERLEVENETEEEALRDTALKFNITEKDAEKYLDELDRSINLYSKKISSKVELTELGLTSVGTGVYKDAEHHIWNLKKEGEGYSIIREAEEEDILEPADIDEGDRTASKKVAREITIEGASPEDVTKGLSGIKGEFASLVYNADTTGTAARGSIDEDEYPDFKAAAESTGLKVAEMERTNKVFSDEAVTTGISHYLTMGFTEKEAINNFIASYDLDKKEYEPAIKELLAKYN